MPVDNQEGLVPLLLKMCKMVRISGIAFFLLLFSFTVKGVKPIVRITVGSGNTAYTDFPVSVSADEIGISPDGKWRLVEVVGSRRIEKPFQLMEDTDLRVYWKLDGMTPARSERVFEFEKKKPGSSKNNKAERLTDDLVLSNAEGRPLLAYRYTVKAPPEGIDPLYGRAGYIHPLYTLSGEVLTRIQPPDHYHHYGIWNPWTRVEYGNKVYDLWNLKDGQGTVRFNAFDGIEAGPVAAGFKAGHEHVIFEEGSGERCIIREQWHVRTFPAGSGYYLCDITSVLTVPGERVTLKEYRYGGLGFRATEQWTNKNSEVITSGGKERPDADGSAARWAIVSGELGNGRGGILFMSHPGNYNHPEPVRIWPVNGNRGRGDQFFNFSPTKNKDWVLMPGTPYTLKYRLLVFDGEFTATEAEKVWQAFANPPSIQVIKL